MTKDEALGSHHDALCGRAAEEVFSMSLHRVHPMTSSRRRSLLERWSRDSEMSEEFDMMAIETVINPYLSADSSFNSSPETAAKVDREVLAHHQRKP
jgi:cell division protease FtsH